MATAGDALVSVQAQEQETKDVRANDERKRRAVAREGDERASQKEELFQLFPAERIVNSE